MAKQGGGSTRCGGANERDVAERAVSEAEHVEADMAREWIHAEPTRRRLIAFARRFLGDQQEAEDIVQETLLRAGAAFSRLRSRERLEAWLFRICRHAAIDRVRARRVRQSVWGQLPESVDPELSEGRGHGQGPVPLPSGSLRGMPAHHRLLLCLHYERGLSQARLCALSGLSAPALRVRLYRARQALRAVVKPSGVASR
ncbi:MAG: hypothetical protein DHS20C15_17470 [Planctomycetota bacterium]|nr:MAG: hypothetical protein DHS20C15_17470 [Planctomycetota bacterium]